MTTKWQRSLGPTREGPTTLCSNTDRVEGVQVDRIIPKTEVTLTKIENTPISWSESKNKETGKPNWSRTHVKV